MMTLLAISIFGVSFGVAAYAIVSTVLPKMDRIAEALSGRVPVTASPLSQLVLAERRIAVRRWAAEPRSATMWREAA